MPDKADKVLSGHCNNGAYAVYIDTDAGYDNEFDWTVQEQTTASYYLDSANTKIEGYVENSGEPSLGQRLRAKGFAEVPHPCGSCGKLMTVANPNCAFSGNHATSSSAAPTAPEGMKLVPMEPTSAMCVAGHRAYEKDGGVYAAYKAMLAACGEKKT